MKALLLAAGVGSRLAPLTSCLPKCLVPIQGVPLLDLWLNFLFSADIDEILVNTHHHADIVKEHVRHSPFAARISVTYEPQLLGTGGTVWKNREFFADKEFLVIHADNLSFFDLQALLIAHRSLKDVFMTMMTFTTHQPHQCGIVETNAQGLVVKFHEKVKHPPSCIANAALYVMNQNVFGILRQVGKEIIDLSTEVIPRCLGRIGTFHNSIYHLDIGTLESYKLAQKNFPLAKHFPLLRLSRNKLYHERLPLFQNLLDAAG